jgi:hypothetical protein
MNEPISMKGISRIDTKDTHGWYVRIYKNGKTYSKLYSDNKYGGKDRALQVAYKARLVALEALKDLPKESKRRLVMSDKRNKSGIIGVSKTTKIRQWSVRKYGLEEARRLATDFRREVMEQIYGNRVKFDD